MVGTPPPLSRIYRNSLDHLLAGRAQYGETQLAQLLDRPNGSLELPREIPNRGSCRGSFSEMLAAIPSGCTEKILQKPGLRQYSAG